MCFEGRDLGGIRIWDGYLYGCGVEADAFSGIDEKIRENRRKAGSILEYSNFHNGNNGLTHFMVL